jgi:hypothetical protein
MIITLRTILFAVAGLNAYAQIEKAAIAAPSAPAASAFLSPIPLYPANGAVPDELSGNYVFLDGTTHDLVISYPADLAISGTPALGSRTELRIELKTHVNPMVYVSFSTDPSGRLKYAYTIVNQPPATRDIASWSLTVPIPGSNLPVRAVDQEFVARHVPELSTPAGWTTSMSPPEKGLATIRWSKSGTTGIALSSALSGITVSSPLLPGFVHINFAGSASDAGLELSSLPSAVRSAVDAFNATSFNQVTVLNLGPKFPVGTNKLTIAANFLEGITSLTMRNYIRADSPFVKEATAALTAYLKGAESAADGPASDYIGTSLVLVQPPAAGLETQIYQALQLSLLK